uniref:Uncharacterized protein n=1 Tax=Oryza rufipogon TaxID=4529 RepID=A0A0E0RDZ1_ORYRU
MDSSPGGGVLGGELLQFRVGEDKICQAINKRNEEGDVGLKATSAPPPTSKDTNSWQTLEFAN